MEESPGKMARQPIKCWGYEGDHLYRDRPHKGDKMKTAHIIHEETIVEYVGRKIPRIYAIPLNIDKDTINRT
jgi:hypothetical protein